MTDTRAREPIWWLCGACGDRYRSTDGHECWLVMKARTQEYVQEGTEPTREARPWP